MTNPNRSKRQMGGGSSQLPMWIGIFIAITAISFVLNLIFAISLFSTKARDFGQIGDLFAITSTLISGITLFMVCLGV